jgi:hypothetical protein
MYSSIGRQALVSLSLPKLSFQALTSPGPPLSTISSLSPSLPPAFCGVPLIANHQSQALPINHEPHARPAIAIRDGEKEVG